MTDQLHVMPAHTLSRLMAKGDLRSREVTAALLEHISATDGQLGNFLAICAEQALVQADEADKRRAAGAALSALDGIPVLPKDILCTKGITTTCASRILESFVPPYDCTVVERLKKSGAVIIGKANMDEFAMGSSNESSAFKPSRNPWKPSCTPGGSSGGSASAVAAGQVPLSLGTDTGGSIRLPASFCGILGLKPTYGRVSRYGVIAYASSLDQVGPFARNARDLAMLLGVIAGNDPRDATSATEPVPDYLAACTQGSGSLKGMRIGIPEEYYGQGLDAEVGALIGEVRKALRELGAVEVPLTLPLSRYAIETYYIVATAEASSNLARYDGVKFGYRDKQAGTLEDMYLASRSAGFGEEVKRRIMLGTYVLSAGYYDAYYKKACQIRRLIANDYAKAFGQVDVLLTPTAPGPAFELGSKLEDPLQLYLQDIYTTTVNLAGLPGLSVPCGFTKAGLPTGFQLIGPRFSETTLLKVAHAYEGVSAWHDQVAPRSKGGAQ